MKKSAECPHCRVSAIRCRIWHLWWCPLWFLPPADIPVGPGPQPSS